MGNVTTSSKSEGVEPTAHVVLVPPVSMVPNLFSIPPIYAGYSACDRRGGEFPGNADTGHRICLMSSATPWWRHAVVYQVYIRSFADGNGDGVGDIEGLRSRLGHIKSLGVDAVWVNPWYDSPLRDGGYDVADYRRINPQFGSLPAAEELIVEADRLGLRLMVDLVPNHTSSQHAWFREALAAGPGSVARSRYHFRAGRGVDGSEPPSDWQSVFGGPAWTRVPDGEWYLHLFDPSQPDLNWANPEVRGEFLDIMAFWLDRGAAGFRVDVAQGLVKAPGYPDVGTGDEDPLAPPQDVRDHPFWNRSGLFEIVAEWRTLLDTYQDKAMIAEAWVPDWVEYIAPGRYHQAFDFTLLQSPWDASTMRERIAAAVTESATVGAVPTWVLSNHDVVRHPTRYGLPAGTDERRWLFDGDRALFDPDLGLRRARAALLLVLGLPGSVYLYQGEELGLHEVVDLPFEVLDDPVWERSGRTAKGRDGCRVPLPWSATGPSLGFGTDGSWLPQPPGWGVVSVESQDGVVGSTLELYRAALDLRSRVLRDDEYLGWLDLGGDVISFRRGSGVVCVVNFGPRPVDVPGGEVLLTSGPLTDGRLPADTAVWVQAT